MSTRSFIIAITIVVMSVTGYMIFGDNGVPSKPAEHAASSEKSRGSSTSKNQSKLLQQENKFGYLSDDSAPWKSRVMKLRDSDLQSLSKTEIEELYKLLSYDPSPLQEESWYVITNEIMEQLRLQGVGTGRYTNTLLEIIQNSSRDKVIRDYAIQHLVNWFVPIENRRPFFYEKNEDNILSGIKALEEVITDPSTKDSSIPGTALMGLVNLSESDTAKEEVQKSFDKLAPWLRETILGINDPTMITQTTVINTVAMMNRKEYLPAIRDILSSETTTDSAKLTSIAALGYLAEESDLPFLQKISEGNTKFKHAAYAALIKISKR